MPELAKTHISITDDSAYASGTDTLVPLYVFATASDKLLDESTGEIALGTTKKFANQVSVVTSKRDVIEKFGIPYFAESNGTVLQGDERNEYGLYALYDAMGSTSFAYALRADLDLGQLAPREKEPTSPAKNGTKWLDLNNTKLGVFRCLGEDLTPANAWEELETVFYEKAPATTEGLIGDIAVYFENGKQVITEKIKANEWAEIGSVNWKDRHVGANIYQQSSINYPKEPTAGSIWVKTSPVNNGALYNVKNYVKESGRWNEVKVPFVTSLVDAEAAFGIQLNSGALAIRTIKDSANAEFFRFNGKQSLLEIKSTEAIVGNLPEGQIRFRAVVDGLLKEFDIAVNGGDTSLDDFINQFNEKLLEAGIQTIVATAENTNLFKLSASKTSVIHLEDIATPEHPAALLAGLHIDTVLVEGEKYEGWDKFTEVKASFAEPRNEAEEGTLWFNDDFKVDIMVNDGTSWKGYNNLPENAGAKLYVTTKEPTEASENSLWVYMDNDQVKIHRFIGGEWLLADNTDQTTPNGVVFADARENAGPSYAESKHTPFSTEEKDMMKSDFVDPDCVNPQSYPAGILLFNTRFTPNTVKEFKANPFKDLMDSGKNYTVGGFTATLSGKLSRWVNASGNALNGEGLFGAKAQRKMVVNALAGAVVSNDDIRTSDYDIFFATCPGYPEVDDELINLNIDKKEMFEIVTDTPKELAPYGKDIQDWGTNANRASSHGSEGRVLKNEFVTRQYPPMGLTTNVDGAEIAVPTSIAKMKNLLVLPRGQIAAGVQNGQVTNLASVGYITDEQEYSSVVLNDGLGEICSAQNINPVMPRRNTGLLFWGESTENPQTSSLSDEHAIITLLRLKRRLEQVCLPFFFRINNPSLRAEFYRALQNVAMEFIGTGEIYDFALEVESENTPDRINRKELWAAMAIEIAKGVEQIYIPIRVVATGALSK